MSQSNTPTTRSRRFHYGLLAVVLIVALLAILMVVNMIVYDRVQKWPWMRQDFTATRRYSLSPQTLNLLETLDQPISIVSLYDDRAAESHVKQPVVDLVREYDRRSASITAEQIDPVKDVHKLNQFHERIRARYEGVLGQYETAMREAEETIRSFQVFGHEHTGDLQKAMEDMGQTDPAQRMIGQLYGFFANLDQLAEDVDSVTDNLTSSELPDFDQAISVPRDTLAGIRNGVLNPAIGQFERWLDDDVSAAAARNLAVTSAPRYRALAAEITAVVDRLGQFPPSDYADTRAKIMRDNSLILMTNETVMVLALGDIYAEPEGADPDEPRPEYRFRGEEAITGALVRLTFDQKPKVVFVHAHPFAVLGNNQSVRFNYVAERLGGMNFEVEEWSPTPQPSPYGQPQPPSPPPVREEGQTMVLVVLPSPAPNVRTPIDPAEMVSKFVGQHLAAGQPALFLVAQPAMSRFDVETPPDQMAPELRQLEQWGIEVETHHVVSVELFDRRRGEAYSFPAVQLERWPDDVHPIVSACRGLIGMVQSATPIKLPDRSDAGITYTPLITTPKSTWAIRQPPRGEDDPQGPFCVAAAAERGAARLIVIGDMWFATDAVTMQGPIDFMTGQTLYYTYPANAEFFVNSVFWLAELDDLIATTARSQDVRRIDAISRPAEIALWLILLGALPLSCLGVGVAVWLRRRR